MALDIAREEGALYYMVSDPLPPEMIADPDAVAKTELFKQAQKWNKKDPTIRAAILIRETKDAAGTMYALRTEADIKRLIEKHGTAFYLVSEFLPEPSAEQIRAARVTKANKQLETWRKKDKRIVAAVIYQKAGGSTITSSLSRDPALVLALIKRQGATSADYFISDPVPGVEDNPNAGTISQLQDRIAASKKRTGRKGRTK